MNNKRAWELVIYGGLLAAIIVTYILGIPQGMEKKRNDKYIQPTPSPYVEVEGVQ